MGTGAGRVQTRESYPLEIELQTGMCLLMWLLGSKGRSSVRAAGIPK